jgi:hypothetical protein
VTRFFRTITVTVDPVEDETVRLRGLLEDHIYAMEIELEVRIGDGVITSIDGLMKRFTTPWCRDAAPVLQKAVGISVREQGWISRVNRDIGRQGCQHFAELLIECGRCLDTARMSQAVTERLERDARAAPVDVAGEWIESHPEAWQIRSP